MNKKGFTLVELLGVIAILAIIIGISFAIYTRVRHDVLNQELENTISYIEAQAENYANDTNITVVSVEDLILNGYVEPDDETDIYNPVDNSSLNCYLVRSTYEDGEFTSLLEIKDENLLERNDGTCSKYQKDGLASIGVQEISEENNNLEGINDEVGFKLLDDNTWFKNNVYLAVLEGNTPFDKEGATYEWRSNYGTTTTDSTTQTAVSAGVASQIPYTVTVRWQEEGNNLEKSASATIKIDREAPRIIGIEVPDSTEWTTKKTVTITATDGNGSGLYGIYVGKDLTECSENKEDYDPVTGETFTEDIVEMGTYRACVIDNVGNVSNISDAFEITNVDGSISHIDLIGNPTNTDEDGNINWINKVTLTGTTYDSQSGIVSYGFANSDSKDETLPHSIAKTTSQISEQKEVTQNGTYYFCAKDDLGNHGCANYTVSNIDTIKPTGKLTINQRESDYIPGSGQSKYAFSFVLNVSVNDVADTKTGDTASKTSGLNGYQITTSSSTPQDWIAIDTEEDDTYTTTYTVNENATYYLWIRDKAGNTNYTTFKVSDVVERTTRSKTVSNIRSEISSTISKSEYISEAVYLDSVTISSGGGRVSSKSLSNHNVNFTVTGGNTYTGLRDSTCNRTADSYPAHVDSYEDCECDRGDRLSGGRCVGSRGASYTLTGNNSTMTCFCNNGVTNGCSDPGASTPCAPGYYRTNDAYGCTFTLRDGQSCTGSKVQQTGHCYATCYFDDYPPSCRTITDYYCSGNDSLSYRTCYGCDYGERLSSGRCYYDCQVEYDYWKYSVTITYYKLK